MLRYGVLALLIERRGYGYELVQRLSARLGPAWQLNRSAVYTALDQLLAEALIVPHSHSRERRSGARAAGRVVYEATAAGVAEYEAWLARPPERIEPVRSELALKVALASAGDASLLLSAVDHQQLLVEQALREETATLPAAAAPAAPPALLATAATMRLQTELAWLQIVREAVQPAP